MNQTNNVGGKIKHIGQPLCELRIDGTFRQGNFSFATIFKWKNTGTHFIKCMVRNFVSFSDLHFMCLPQYHDTPGELNFLWPCTGCCLNYRGGIK